MARGPQLRGRRRHPACVIDAYADEGFDFIALRLLPDVGVQQMQPVRVVQPGDNPVASLFFAAAVATVVGRRFRRLAAIAQARTR